MGTRSECKPALDRHIAYFGYLYPIQITLSCLSCAVRNSTLIAKLKDRGWCHKTDSLVETDYAYFPYSLQSVARFVFFRNSIQIRNSTLVTKQKIDYFVSKAEWMLELPSLSYQNFNLLFF